MSLYKVLFDGATGRFKRENVVYVAGGFSDTDFDVVATNGQTDFTPGGTITAGGKIDVMVNGIKTREGSSFDWQRDVGNNKIVFNTAVRQSGVVCVRLFS